jgi:uncharacterized radical SAM superfamily protein
MNRCFGWAALVAAGIVLGSAWSSLERSHVAVAAQNTTGDDAAVEMIAELKEMKVQLKEINAILHSNQLRVVPVINADAQP